MAFQIGLGSLSDNVEVKRVQVPVAAGTATTNSVSFDALECQAVMGIIQLGTVLSTGVVTVYGQESDDDSTFENISGCTAATDASATNVACLVAAHRPLFSKRYFRVQTVTSVANGVIDGGVIIGAGKKSTPITQGATIGATATT